MFDAIIVDIDGTVADVSHRRHHVMHGKKEWGKFFEKMGDDLPIYPVIAVIESLVKSNSDYKFFIFTGRPEENREITERWLAYHCPVLWDMVGSSGLFMRPVGNFLPDVEVKVTMLNVIEERHKVIATFDDRQSVVDMWRARGITCFQCAPGDFDEKPPVSPGTLHMLIGPSGAGKSTFAEKEVDFDIVVSSDALRAEINDGDIKDMSKNTQVFAAMHAIIKARIENGLDTVVDATNIHPYHRRDIRDLVPRTCHIIYHVIDRHLADKIRDAGWRSGVQVKGKPLIAYHHSIFLANIKEILAGDGDQRVDVTDHRPEDLKR